MLDTSLDRRAARLRRDDPDVGRCAADDHQRHPRLLEDRGRPGRARPGAVRPPRLHRGRGRCARAVGRREAPRARLHDRRRPAAHDRRRPGPASPDRDQPALERHQVHRTRRGRAERVRAGRSGRGRSRRPARGGRRGPRPRHRNRHPGRIGWTGCSSRSARPMRRSRGATAGRASGLAISRRLAELMDGSLAATSDGVAGRGSTFQLTFAGRRGARTEIAPEPVRLVDLAGRRVLVVDDNATNRRILRTLIERWGMTARDTGSPREALGWVVGGEQFDLAIARPAHAGAGRDRARDGASCRRGRRIDARHRPLVDRRSRPRRATQSPHRS